MVTSLQPSAGFLQRMYILCDVPSDRDDFKVPGEMYGSYANPVPFSLRGSNTLLSLGFMEPTLGNSEV